MLQNIQEKHRRQPAAPCGRSWDRKGVRFGRRRGQLHGRGWVLLRDEGVTVSISVFHLHFGVLFRGRYWGGEGGHSVREEPGPRSLAVFSGEATESVHGGACGSLASKQGPEESSMQGTQRCGVQGPLRAMALVAPDPGATGAAVTSQELPDRAWSPAWFPWAGEAARSWGGRWGGSTEKALGEPAWGALSPRVWPGAGWLSCFLSVVLFPHPKVGMMRLSQASRGSRHGGIRPHFFNLLLKHS